MERCSTCEHYKNKPKSNVNCFTGNCNLVGYGVDYYEYCDDWESYREIWKTIESNSCYQVSNLGRVRSLGFTMNNGHFRKGKILKLHDDGVRGYLRVNISGKFKKVHRLVAQAFIPNPKSKPQVNHKDGNKLNNSVDNLEWCTASENLKHAFDTGLRKKQYGLNNPNTKLTYDEVEYIRNNCEPNSKEFGVRALSRKLNVSRKTISNIINNKCNY